MRTRRPCSSLSYAATSPIAWMPGSLARSAASTAMPPSASSSPASLASSVLGMTPAPTTTRSTVSSRPSASRTCSASSARMMDSTLVPAQMRTPRLRRRTSNHAPTSRPNARSSMTSSAMTRLTSLPVSAAEAANSAPMKPPPTTSQWVPSPRWGRISSASANERRTWTRSAVSAPKSMCRGWAPVASTSEP